MASQTIKSETEFKKEGRPLGPPFFLKTACKKTTPSGILNDNQNSRLFLCSKHRNNNRNPGGGVVDIVYHIAGLMSRFPANKGCFSAKLAFSGRKRRIFRLFPKKLLTIPSICAILTIEIGPSAGTKNKRRRKYWVATNIPAVYVLETQKQQPEPRRRYRVAMNLQRGFSGFSIDCC